eukprot:456103-Prymnesium_polylepis.2
MTWRVACAVFVDRSRRCSSVTVRANSTSKLELSTPVWSLERLCSLAQAGRVHTPPSPQWQYGQWQWQWQCGLALLLGLA